MASSKKRTQGKRQCPCCKHAPPHCRCRLMRPPRAPVAVDPHGPRPGTGQIDEWLTLAEVAWLVGRAMGYALYTRQVSAAIRALGLGVERQRYKAVVRGSVHFRQMTQVHPMHLTALQDYLDQRYT